MHKGKRQDRTQGRGSSSSKKSGKSPSGEDSYGANREKRKSRPRTTGSPTSRSSSRKPSPKRDDSEERRDYPPRRGSRSAPGTFSEEKPRARKGEPGREKRSSKPRTTGSLTNRSSTRKSSRKRDEGEERRDYPPRQDSRSQGRFSEGKPRAGRNSSEPDREKRSSRPRTTDTHKNRSSPGKLTRKRDDREDYSSKSSQRPAPRKFSERKPAGKRLKEGKEQSEEYAPRRRKRSSETESRNIPSPAGPIRLNKYIANSGVCSRREADQLIEMGLITVNGKTITELGFKVDLTDEVRHEGKLLRAEKPVYILLNKPKGFLTTTKDPQDRNTVMSLLGNTIKERVYPVGRLDRNTTGLLLLTNDGDLADKLSHPSYEVRKVYKVELDRPVTKADAERIMQGISLEEGRAVPDDFAIVSDDRKVVGLELHIGWNRVVRRIFEALGYQVVKLDRTYYAGLDKKDLPRGHWRFLKAEEVVKLKHFQ